MAHSLIQHAGGMATGLILRALRGVPEECPNCASPHLEPEQGENQPRPVSSGNDRTAPIAGGPAGPSRILEVEDGQTIITREGDESDEHSIMTVPLRTIVRPGDPPIEPLKKAEIGPPEPVVYFAYGSNMSTARLRERTPSCKPLGIATLPGHALRFHKRSTDKSGKCNAFACGNDDRVIGRALFSFDPAERAKLDNAEGVGSGYEHAVVTVINDKGRRQKVLDGSRHPRLHRRQPKALWLVQGLCPCRWQGTRPTVGVHRRIHPVGSRRSKIPTRYGTRSSGPRSEVPGGETAASVRDC